MQSKKIITHIVSEFMRAQSSNESVNIEPEILQHARNLFVCAGTKRLEIEFNLERWVQIGVRFRRQNHALNIFDPQFTEVVSQALKKKKIVHFSFVFKEPGLRIRFSGIHSQEFRFTVENFLNKKFGKDIESLTIGNFEGETYQFGGNEGLKVFQNFSTIDSLAIMKFQHLRLVKKTRLDAETFSLLVLTDLFNKCLKNETWEIWDAWSNMRLAGRIFKLSRREKSALARWQTSAVPIFETIIWNPHRLKKQMSKEEKVIFKDYTRVNLRIARALQHLESRGKLEYGMRKIIPFYAVHHWNRFFVGVEQQIAFSHLLAYLYNPKLNPRP